MGDAELTDEVRITWEAVAPAWEAHRTQVFEGFRPVSDWLVEHVAPEPGQTILEVAAGPGDTGFLVAERLGESGRLISTDIAPRMVEAVQHGASERGLSMANQWMGLIMMSLVQRGHAPVADPFGPAGPFSLADHDRNRSLLTEAGFTEVEVTELAGTMPFDTSAAYWDLQSQVGGPIPAVLAGLPADEVAEIRAEVEATVEQYPSGDGFAVPSSLVAVAAR